MVFHSFFTVLMGWCQGIRETLTQPQLVEAMEWLDANAGVSVDDPPLLAWIGHPNASTTATVKDALDTAGDPTQLLLVMLLMVCGAVGYVAEGDTEWLRQFDVPNLNLI